MALHSSLSLAESCTASLPSPDSDGPVLAQAFGTDADPRAGFPLQSSAGAAGCPSHQRERGVRGEGAAAEGAAAPAAAAEVPTHSRAANCNTARLEHAALESTRGCGLEQAEGTGVRLRSLAAAHRARELIRSGAPVQKPSTWHGTAMAPAAARTQPARGHLLTAGQGGEGSADVHRSSPGPTLPAAVCSDGDQSAGAKDVHGASMSLHSYGRSLADSGVFWNENLGWHTSHRISR